MSWLRVLTGPDLGGRDGRRRASARRRLGRQARRAVALLLAPVAAAGTSLVPVAATAAAGAVAVTAVSAVVAAAPAKAATGTVLVLAPSGSSFEAQYVPSGYTVTTVTTFSGITTSQFQSYSAIVIGDPSSGTCSSAMPSSAVSTDATWEPVINGNVAVIGTAPALAGSTAKALVSDALAYAVAAGSGKTGLYVSLNCEDSTEAAGSKAGAAGGDPGWLNGVEDPGNSGFTVTGQSTACPDSGTVNTWEGAAAAGFGGLASSSLASWASPACSVAETFNSWPTNYAPVAFDTAASPADFTASDGLSGQPYVLLGVPPAAALAVAPSTGGVVAAGASAGGQGNAADRGVSQASAGDPVDTENGDFTQSASDLSIPTFGPALSFSRTYDAQAAQQQTQTRTPGPLGYGWTDNWASSLSTARPVPGDIYSLDGLRASSGNGGPATSAVLSAPAGVVSSGGNTYIADTLGARVQEIPGTSGTQWGQSMTAGDVYTIAGVGHGQSGAVLNHPEGLAFDAAGDLYITDAWDNRVEEVPATSKTQWGQSMTANDLYTVAGSAVGSSGSSGDGGLATSALLLGPGGVAVDSAGNLYIGDGGNNRVQEVAAVTGTQFGQSMTANDIYTLSGGTFGSSGDGGPATAAKLDGPEGIAVDASKNVYFADSGNNRVQEIAAVTGTQFGQSMTANDIYTIAGSATGTSGTSGDGGAAKSALLDGPQAVTWVSPNVYIGDSLNNRVQEIAGSAHTQWGQTMTASDIYTIAGSSAGTAGFSGDGGAATAAMLNDALSVTLDASANLYVADADNNRVRKVTASTAVISTYAGNGAGLAQEGDGGPATAAALSDPMEEAFDSQGDIYIADAGNNRIQEIAASSHTQFGIAMTGGDVYTVAGQADGQAGCQCDGHPATQAFLDNPMGLVLDTAGDLFIADTGNNRIQEVPATTGTQWGQSMTAGDMYTIAGNQFGTPGTSGDGGAAGSALLDKPMGLQIDPAGDIYVADTWNNRIQEMALSSGTQWGQAMTAGDIYTVAGSPAATSGSSGDGGAATTALLLGPGGIAIDPAGNLYIGDSGNNRVQEVAGATGAQRGQSMTKGDMYTIAGGTWGSFGDGGPAASSTLDGPGSIQSDAAGNVYFSDSGNNRIQEIAATSGTQWGQSMTASDIYTVAGSPTAASGNAGDGGPATSALMSSTQSISLDPAGDLYVTDNSNNTVREVASTTAATIVPAPGQTSALAIAPAGTAPGGITVTQPGGAQVTFWAQSGGTCASQYVTAGGYCVLPQDQGATLTFNSSTQVYTFLPAPGDTSYTYGWNGPLTSETDTAGNALTITYNTPAPGAGNCPSTAASCATITSASGRALVIGSNASALVTSVTDPLGRRWAYAYTSSDLTSATDPMGHVTSYAYGAGSGNNNPLLANDLLTITGPNAQAGGPDAGDATVNVYDNTGRVTRQTDPSGYVTRFNYCVSAADGNCMNASTGTGYVTVTDPDSNETLYGYTAGALASQADLTGTTLISETDAQPDLTADGTTAAGTMLDTQTTDGNGNSTTYTYNSAGNTTSVTTPDVVASQTATVTEQFTALQNDSCAAAAQASTQCSSSQVGPTPVAPAGVITPPSSAPPQGVTYTLYDTHGNQLYTTTGIYQPGATTASYQRTSYQLFKGNSITLPGMSTAVSCTTTPPSPSLPCATINADGTVTQLAYNAAGDLTSTATPDGSGAQTATTIHSYDGDGEQTSTIAPDGNVTGANAGNYTTTTSWNADEQKTSVSQGGGTGHTVTPRTTGYGFDADGNQATVEDARGFTTTTTYNADDKATMVTNPDGNATLTCYDGDGNTVQTVPPAGVAASNLTASSCPASYPAGYSARLASDATVSTFNALGHETQETTPAPAGQTGSETTTFSYDGNGNPVTTTAPPASSGGQNQVTTDTYGPAGQLTSQTTGSGTSGASTISYCYNPDGDRTSVVSADGNTSAVGACEASSPWVISSNTYPAQATYQTTFSYDSADELVSATTPVTSAAPSGATTTSTYDPVGNMLTRTDPDGVKTTWAYTPLNLTASVSYSGSSAHSVTYAYDASGLKTGMTDGTGTSSYVYDPVAELTSATNAAGQVTGYGYNSDGQVTSINYPLPSTATWAASATVTYGYDNADLLTSVTDFNGKTITIGNTADGLPATENLGSTGDTITTSYDNADAASAIVLKNASSTLQSFAYADAPSGNIISETDTPTSSRSPAAYAYNAKSQVTSMTPGSGSTLNYGFDASGNLTTLPTGAAGTYDNAGELTSSSLSGVSTAYSYNANGEQLTAKQAGTTISSGTWNGAGQLTTYDNTAADMTAAIYDGSGARATSTSTPTGGSAVTQQYVWNATPQVPQMIMDSSNAYIYGCGGTAAEQVNLSTGASTYLVSDSLGSVRGTVNASGTLTGTTSYFAWGSPETVGGLTASTPFGYAGGYTDPDGLIYLINRYYNPQTGQFMSVDPAIAQTLQPYAYADGNPISNIDPTGLCSWWSGCKEFAVAAAAASWGACGVFLSFAGWICAGVAGGAYGAAEYMWDHWGHIAFWGLVDSFLDGFVAGLVIVATAEGVMYVLAYIAEWAGRYWAAERIWAALDSAAGAGRHAKMNLWGWINHLL